MNAPATDPIAALRQCVDRAYAKGIALFERAQTQPLAWGEQQDHRTEVVSDLFDTLDSIEPGLGKTLFAAMYPLTSDDPDNAFDEFPGVH